MALIDEYRNRYSTQRRTEISNPQSSSTSTPDTTRETYAATDVTAAFKMRGITLDSTIDTHVVVGVQGIEARLILITGQPGGRELWESFLDDLKFLAETTSRDRISPTTDSLLDPTQDTSGDLPAMDRENFDGYISEAPSKPTTQD